MSDEIAEVTLKALAEGDVSERYVSWLNDYDVVKYTEQRHHTHDLLSVREYVRRTLENEGVLLYAIMLANEHVGNLKIGPIDRRHASSKISYFVGERRYWGAGVASRAIARAIVISRNELGLVRLEAGVYSGNVASERALSRNGFRLEGILRERYLFEGRRIDGRLFGLVL